MDYFQRLRKEISEETKANIAVFIVIFSVIGVIYSIIAGIWGYAPIHNMNWKIFGTSVVIFVMGITFYGVFTEDKKSE